MTANVLIINTLAVILSFEIFLIVVNKCKWYIVKGYHVR